VTTSTLSEAEVKYNMLVEKTILMEQEIEEKEKMQEEMQRLKDEVRGGQTLLLSFFLCFFFLTREFFFLLKICNWSCTFYVRGNLSYKCHFFLVVSF